MGLALVYHQLFIYYSFINTEVRRQVGDRDFIIEYLMASSLTMVLYTLDPNNLKPLPLII